MDNRPMLNDEWIELRNDWILRIIYFYEINENQNLEVEMSICAGRTKEEILNHYNDSHLLYDEDQNTKLGFELVNICLKSLLNMEERLNIIGNCIMCIVGHDIRRHILYKYLKRFGYIEASYYAPTEYYHKKPYWFKEIINHI